MSNFDQYSEYYELLYNDKDTDKECDYLFSLVNRYSVSGNNWVEFGAGSGRHAEVLRSRGINWTGYEKSNQMLLLAKQKGLQIFNHDITKVINSTNQFDVAISIFHVISYISKNSDLLVAFQNAYDLLKTGGVFIFDIWFSAAVLSQKPEARIKKVQNDRIEVVRQAKPTTDHLNNTVNVHFDISVKRKSDNKVIEFSEDHLMRHFSVPEIKLIANSVGFDFLLAEEWLSGKRPGIDTWGIAIVLGKK